MWDIILEAKQGRAIVLTTHSMEEADVLADTITIIAKGRLRCFGSALRLKTKFGTGFRIAVSVDGSAGATGASSSALSGLGGSTSRMAGLGGSTQRLGGPIGHHHTAGMSAASDRTGTAHGNAAAVAVAQRVAGVIDFFKEQLGVDPTETGRAYTTFTVPRAQEAQLAAFLHLLAERKRELGVTDVQMSLATLEQARVQPRLVARAAPPPALTPCVCRSLPAFCRCSCASQRTRRLRPRWRSRARVRFPAWPLAALNLRALAFYLF